MRAQLAWQQKQTNLSALVSTSAPLLSLLSFLSLLVASAALVYIQTESTFRLGRAGASAVLDCRSKGQGRLHRISERASERERK